MLLFYENKFQSDFHTDFFWKENEYLENACITFS